MARIVDAGLLARPDALPRSADRRAGARCTGAADDCPVSRRDASIGANHRSYLAMDACLRRAPQAIRTDFFAAAACVTHPFGGLGVLDGFLGRLVFTADQCAFLRFVHGALATVNHGWFVQLRLGRAVPGCEGRRGRALDHALVDLEQSLFTQAMGDFFAQDPRRRARFMADINRTLHEHPLLRCPLLEARLGMALASARARCRFDLGDETQRRSVGHALVDLVRAGRA